MKRYQTILICMAFCAAAAAQDADQLFNPAAKEYIYGNLPVASNLVCEALAKFPTDEKLLKLKKLIEEQQQKDQQKQDQDKQDQDKKDQDKKDQQQKDQQKQDQDKQDQDKKDQEKKDQDKQDQQQQDQADQSDQTDQKEEKPNEQQPAQPQQAGEMSPQEAQQLLDAMKQNEKDQRSDLRLYLGQPVRVNKDW